MYKVMIVEDEHIVRLALRSLIDWENNGMTISVEAVNGKEGLDCLDDCQIDLIITDINMPVMNGIDMMKELKHRSYEGKIVVLSAYNDYDFVREAFMMGASDYILKSEMDPVAVLGLVKKLMNTERSRSDDRDYVSSSTEKTEQSQHNVMDYGLMLKTIAEGNVTIDESTILSVFSDMAFDGGYDCCVLRVDAFDSIKGKYIGDAMAEFAKHVLDTIKGQIKKDSNSHVVFMTADTYMILSASGHGSEMAKRNRIETFLGRVRQLLKRYLDISVSIGVVQNKISYVKLHTYYEEAKRLADLRYIFGKGKIIYEENATFIKQVEGKSIIGQEVHLLTAVRNLDVGRAEVELSNLLNQIAMYRSESIDDLLGYYLELIMLIIMSMDEAGGEDVYSHNTNFYEMIRDFETKEEIHQFIKNLLGNLMSYMGRTNNLTENQTIREAKLFIENNFNNNISLTTVSEYVELSESYFSKLFMSEMGETFIRYLTRYRMEKARQLLEEGHLKVYEVANEVGYDNVEHFSRVFKKEAGISPKAYKNLGARNVMK